MLCKVDGNVKAFFFQIHLAVGQFEGHGDAGVSFEEFRQCVDQLVFAECDTGGDPKDALGRAVEIGNQRFGFVEFIGDGAAFFVIFAALFGDADA